MNIASCNRWPVYYERACTGCDYFFYVVVESLVYKKIVWNVNCTCKALFCVNNIEDNNATQSVDAMQDVKHNKI